jgi:hypothetical protein
MNSRGYVDMDVDVGELNTADYQYNPIHLETYYHL